jgi:egghead protein (zeste-white 4 protein)
MEIMTEQRVQSHPLAKPPAPEPKRDWQWGIFSGHRLGAIFFLISSVLALYLLQRWFWPIGRTPRTTLEYIWSYGTVLWITQIIPVALGLVGLMSFRHAKRLDDVSPIATLVSLRIVSRGMNVEALSSTIMSCQIAMARTPLFPYVIEVAVDVRDPALPPENEHLSYIVVPPSYQTPHQSLYKARALHYALEVSKLPDDAWIVHLDEETHVTSSGIKGICAMIAEEEATGKLRIGQGAILYHRKWREHPFLTLADSIRTGDDFARFHFQYRFGITLFGLHGSYIVVRNNIEKSIGFDFGPQGSITEDAFWGLVAMERGYRCRWVDGYLEEQSTQSIGDFVRQRRRWYQGLAKVARYAPVRFAWRLSLGINTVLWGLAPLAILYTTIHLFYGFSIPGWVHFLSNFSFAFFIVLYLMGLQVNFDEYGMDHPLKRAAGTIAQIVFFPVFSIMEAAGVIAAIFKPVRGFHVVKK